MDNGGAGRSGPHVVTHAPINSGEGTAGYIKRMLGTLKEGKVALTQLQTYSESTVLGSANP
jgi:hypothetical protein